MGPFNQPHIPHENQAEDSSPKRRQAHCIRNRENKPELTDVVSKYYKLDILSNLSINAKRESFVAWHLLAKSLESRWGR